MFKTTKALVLREVRYKEADRILTIFTDSEGKLSARVRGALRKGSRTAAATQQLSYSELTLFNNKGRRTVNEAMLIEPFTGLRQDLGKLSLGCYFAECLEAISIEEQPEPAMLQLGLNALYALSRGLYEDEHIKAAFEMRLMCLSGYEPNLSACAVCGREEPEEPVLGLEDGCVCCRSCRRKTQDQTALILPETLQLMRYITAAPAKQFLAFKAEERVLKDLSRLSERYLLAHTGRSFSTLEYWKKVR